MAASSSLPSTPDLPSLFVIGDSISIQYGPYLEQALKGKMHYARKTAREGEETNLDFPSGDNGGDSAMVLAYLRHLEAEGKVRPDILLLNCGLHDIKRAVESGEIQVPLAAYRANLEAIVQLGRQLAGAVVWVKTTSVEETIHNAKSRAFHRYNADHTAYSEVEWEVMARLKVPVINLKGFTNNLGTPQEIFADHVHYAGPTRQLQGAFIAGYLEAFVGLRGA